MQSPPRIVDGPGTFESQITDVWERFLNISDIGLDDDFFEMSGDYIVAAQIFAELETRFASPLPLSLSLNKMTEVLVPCLVAWAGAVCLKYTVCHGTIQSSRLCSPLAL